jgi:lipopolysaccharide/colanic/teichoic acid biosynthesis glycosyltransferase
VIPPNRKTTRRKGARATRGGETDHTWDGPISLVRDEGDGALQSDSAQLDRTTARFVLHGVKRGIDVVGALLGLIIALPAIVIVSIAIKIESRGPIFFAHQRLGRGGRLFRCWKFRSMHENAERRLHADETLRHHYVSNHFKIPHDLDPRITRLGRFLRTTSLDELPQLWNVLCGDMSLVGPRPIVPLESSHYGDDASVLLSMRPGLTGAWAVCGRNCVGYPTRAEIELEYVKNWSLANDVSILLKTPRAVFSQNGVH